MIKLSYKFAIMAAAIGVLSSPAIAGKKDDAWAACLWKNVPTTANNWLASEKMSDGFLKPENIESNLRLRLQAACSEQLTPSGKKKPPKFKAKQVREALVATKPETIGPDLIEPDTFYCVAREDGVLLGMSSGFGKASEITSSNPNVSLECKTVRADGQLVLTDMKKDGPDA